MVPCGHGVVMLPLCEDVLDHGSEVGNQVQEHTVNFAIGCVSQGTVEQCVDVLAPESVEEIVNELQDFPQERIFERILERNEDTPLPPIRVEHVTSRWKSWTRRNVCSSGLKSAGRASRSTPVVMCLFLNVDLEMRLGALELGRTLVKTRGRRCQWALRSRRPMIRTKCRR